MKTRSDAFACSSRCLIGACCLLLGWIQAGCSSKTPESTADDSPEAQAYVGEFADIHRLLAEQKYDEAKSLIEQRRAELAPSERLVAWEIDFQAQILRMAHGRTVLYYALLTHNSLPRSPGRE